MSLYWLGTKIGRDFPPVSHALREPNGLLAAGGDLSEPRLLAAYQRGIFPWYSEGQPILWWSPDPRMVLRPEQFHASRSLRRALRRDDWRFTCNRAFDAVIEGCAAPRRDSDETWITTAMREAYTSLQRRGWVHSCEAWRGDTLAGGVYGVAIDRVFFGESMFSAYTNGSKLALWALCRQLRRDNFALIDCQMHTAHLQTLGAELVDRAAFSNLLADAAAHLIKWRPPPSIDICE